MDVPLYQGATQGRPDLFQGTSPGDRGPGFPYGSMAPNRVVNQTIGWQTNPTIPYAYVVRRFKNDNDKSLNVGQFAFIRRHSVPLTDKRLYTLVNLPQLNHLLLTCALHASNQPFYRLQAGESPAVKQANTKKLAQIRRQWIPHGVIQGEIGASTTHSHQEQPQERLVNLIVSGRVPTFNVWGRDGLDDGTNLYFVLYPKRMTPGVVDGTVFKPSLNSDVAEPIKDNQEVSGSGNYYCWQWYPYASAKHTHPQEDAELYRKLGFERNDDNMLDYVRSVYVGRISSKGYMATYASNAHTEAAITSVDKMVTLPKFEMFVDYGNTL